MADIPSTPSVGSTGQRIDNELRDISDIDGNNRINFEIAASCLARSILYLPRVHKWTDKSKIPAYHLSKCYCILARPRLDRWDSRWLASEACNERT